MEKLFEKVARLGAAIKIGVLVGTVGITLAIFYFGVMGGTSAKNAESR